LISFSTGFFFDKISLLVAYISWNKLQGRPVASQGEALAEVHARMLKEVTTSDYGSYDPTPSMEKPHFKLIPN
jgi:hypothetical protein